MGKQHTIMSLVARVTTTIILIAQLETPMTGMLQAMLSGMEVIVIPLFFFGVMTKSFLLGPMVLHRGLNRTLGNRFQN